MKIYDENIDLFDQYLEGQLDSEAVTKFETRLISETELKNAFEDYKATVLIIKSASIYEDTRAIVENNEGSKRLFYLNNWMKLGVAASLSLIVIFSSIFYYNNQTSSEELFHTYFQPYPDIISERSTSSDENAMFEYSLGNYGRAIKLFELKDSLTLNDEFYIGISYLSLGKLKKAELQLKKLLPTEKKELTNWYLSLCYLAQDNAIKATELLKTIQEGEFKHTEALELTKELD